MYALPRYSHSNPAFVCQERKPCAASDGAGSSVCGCGSVSNSRAVHRGVVGSISEAQVLKLEELANRLASLLGGESTSPVPSTEPLPSPQPPGPSKPEEGKEKSKAKVQRLDKFDFSYPPHPDFFNVQYENVVACRPSGAGSQGVIFAETDEPKGIIVVKGSAQPAGEIFATKVVRWVGLIAPEILLLRRKEHPQIEDAVKRFDPALVGKINKAYIQQLEFLPGVTLTDFEESSVMKDNFSK